MNNREKNIFSLVILAYFINTWLKIVSNNLNVSEMYVITYLPSRRVTSACRSSSLVWVKSSRESTFSKSPCPWEAYLLSAWDSSSDLWEDTGGVLKALYLCKQKQHTASSYFPTLFGNETLQNSSVCFLIYKKTKQNKKLGE